MNKPAPHDPSRSYPTPQAVTELQAWHELKLQMEVLHAQLQYLKLLLRLGVSAW